MVYLEGGRKGGRSLKFTLPKKMFSSKSTISERSVQFYFDVFNNLCSVLRYLDTNKTQNPPHEKTFSNVSEYIPVTLKMLFRGDDSMPYLCLDKKVCSSIWTPVGKSFQ